jgi:pimeloyl-ACP methyl ester carboxylesterase
MATFVLIHGACHTGACWDEVVPFLEEMGHKAYTPTIGGNGEGENKYVTLEQAYQPIIDLIIEKDLTEVVLLGHSLGGIAVQHVAQAVPDRIRRLVFMGTFLADDGKTIAEAMAELAAAQEADMSLIFGDMKIGEPFMFPFFAFREMFINDVDLATAEAVYEKLTTNPSTYFVEKIDLKKFQALDTPRTYLHGTMDTAVDIRAYEGMKKNIGFHRFIQYDGSHEIMYSNPQEIAKKIIMAGQD